jgi:putative spermidine/putrescine transport system substrate-binding protein
VDHHLEDTLRRRTLAPAIAVLAAGLTISACGSGGGASGSGSGNAATATSAAAFGGMDALVKKAKSEGVLNVIALPPDWANYGAILDAFTKKYGVKINSVNPDGSSQDELNAVTSQKGQGRAPDVLDVGTSFAYQATAQKLLAPYQVATWKDIPSDQKDAQGNWYNDYGGYISIGCDAKKVGTCPKTFADLLKPDYKGKVALNGNPTQAAAAFAGVWGASLANGGSLDNIGKGIDFFGKVKQTGNWNPVEITPATVLSGETPISIDWDYLNSSQAAKLKAAGLDWQVNVPTDGLFGGFYSQAISKYAPHPAAARLWEEFLYSDEGQNLWLKGGARPVRLPVLQQAGTADKDALAALPQVSGKAKFPSQQQQTKAQQEVASRWNQVMSG